MSSVTTVILLLDVFFEDEKVAAINAALKKAEIVGEFRYLGGRFGGPKAPQIDAYGCAFNYLHCVHLIELLRALPWDKQDVVQLVINGEHDSGARIFDVIGKCDAEWPIERDWPCDADGNRMED